MDLFRELERGLRAYPERLPIDDFLPPPEEIPTALAGKARYHSSPAGDPVPARRPAGAGPAAPADRDPARGGPPGGSSPRDLDPEVREFLEQQKARGRHDPGEWVQEEGPAPRPGGDEPPPGKDP